MAPKKKRGGGQAKGKSKPVARKAALEPESDSENEQELADAHVYRRKTSKADPRGAAHHHHSSSSDELSAGTQGTQEADARRGEPPKKKKKMLPFPFNNKQTDAMIDW